MRRGKTGHMTVGGVEHKENPKSEADRASVADFIRSVLRLEPRIAVFDCDGTLWANDSGEDFFCWEIKQGLIPSGVAHWGLQRYAAYKEGKLSEEQNCIDSIVTHKGLDEVEVERAASRFVEQGVLPHIFPEMRELVDRLAAAGCEVWAVSSTNVWVVRAATRNLSIPENRVLATCVAIENGRITDRVICVPTGERKAQAIWEFIASTVDVAFGNTIHDLAMLSLARDAFAINPSQDLEQIARKRRWVVYHPSRR